MKLLKPITLAVFFTLAYPGTINAQTGALVNNLQREVTIAWSNHDQSYLQSLFGDEASWTEYIRDIESPSFTTNYSAFYNALTADFFQIYGIHPQQASLLQYRDYYANHRNDYMGDFILPTIAMWYKRPYGSIIPRYEDENSYWNNPSVAGDTYDFLAQIDREDVIRFVGSYMGLYYGHPTEQKVLKNFWKNWEKRDSSSAARQDIPSLKRAMLAEILSHDPSYAVYELASEEMNLWPELAVDPVTTQEQNMVTGVINAVCVQDNPTVACERFINYASRYNYINDVTVEVQERLKVLYPHIYFVWYHPYPFTAYVDWYYLPLRPIIYRPYPILPPYPYHRPGPRPHRPGHPPYPNGGGNHPGGHNPSGNHHGNGGHGNNPGGHGNHPAGHGPHNPSGNHGDGGNGGNPGNHPGGNGDNPGANPGNNPGGHNPGGIPGGNGTNPGNGTKPGKDIHPRSGDKHITNVPTQMKVDRSSSVGNFQRAEKAVAPGAGTPSTRPSTSHFGSSRPAGTKTSAVPNTTRPTIASRNDSAAVHTTRPSMGSTRSSGTPSHTPSENRNTESRTSVASGHTHAAHDFSTAGRTASSGHSAFGGSLASGNHGRTGHSGAGFSSRR
ncbi:MAG: hypothetical protein J5601_00625 [Elusimicrobiaceae bacterium]|nr:hypothetical protein [Elusimicrobiaceae bacterium]